MKLTHKLPKIENAYSISKDLFSTKVDSDRPDIIDHVAYPQVKIE